MPKYSIAIDDALLKEFLNYKSGQQVNTSTVDKILHLYKPPYITNTAQMVRVGCTDQTLLSQLQASQLTSQTLEALSDLTCYKIILTDDRQANKAHFPYLNIHSPQMVNNYSMSAKVGASRDHIHNYLKGIFKLAKNILIHDPYFEANFSTTNQIFELFNPNNQYNIFFTTVLNTQSISLLKRKYHNLSFPQNRNNSYDKHHDRYILIDNRVEIVISSGVDYIFNNSKECLLVVRLTQ